MYGIHIPLLFYYSYWCNSLTCGLSACKPCQLETFVDACTVVPDFPGRSCSFTEQLLEVTASIPEESLLVLLGPVDVETLQTSFHPNRNEIYIYIYIYQK
jgi:hypothetical protein